LAACHGGGGSGGGSGNVSGLEMASTMSVVTAQSDGSHSMRGANARALANPLPGGDFAADKQNVYVYDESMDSMQMVNMILCLMDQTKAADMVNHGAYIALVDEHKCEQGKNQSSAGST